MKSCLTSAELCPLDEGESPPDLLYDLLAETKKQLSAYYTIDDEVKQVIWTETVSSNFKVTGNMKPTQI